MLIVNDDFRQILLMALWNLISGRSQAFEFTNIECYFKVGFPQHSKTFVFHTRNRIKCSCFNILKLRNQILESINITFPENFHQNWEMSLINI